MAQGGAGVAAGKFLRAPPGNRLPVGDEGQDFQSLLRKTDLFGTVTVNAVADRLEIRAQRDPITVIAQTDFIRSILPRVAAAQVIDGPLDESDLEVALQHLADRLGRQRRAPDE